MPRNELTEVMAVLRAAIARLTTQDASDDRALVRALAHLWSAYDELVMVADADPRVARAS